LQTVANVIVLIGICSISLCQLMVLISNRELYTNSEAYFILPAKHKQCGYFLFFEYTTLQFC